MRFPGVVNVRLELSGDVWLAACVPLLNRSICPLVFKRLAVACSWVFSGNVMFDWLALSSNWRSLCALSIVSCETGVEFLFPLVSFACHLKLCVPADSPVNVKLYVCAFCSTPV